MNKGKKFIDEAWLITCTFSTWCFKTRSKPLSLFMHFQPNLWTASSQLKPFIHAEPLPSFQRVRKLRTSIQTGSGKGPIQGEAAKRHHWSLYPWNVVPLWSTSFWKRSCGMRFMIHQLIPRLQKTSFCHCDFGEKSQKLANIPVENASFLPHVQHVTERFLLGKIVYGSKLLLQDTWHHNSPL